MRKSNLGIYKALHISNIYQNQIKQNWPFYAYAFY